MPVQTRQLIGSNDSGFLQPLNMTGQGLVLEPAHSYPSMTLIRQWNLTISKEILGTVEDVYKGWRSYFLASCWPLVLHVRRASMDLAPKCICIDHTENVPDHHPNTKYGDP